MTFAYYRLVTHALNEMILAFFTKSRNCKSDTGAIHEITFSYDVVRRQKKNSLIMESQILAEAKVTTGLVKHCFWSVVVMQ